VGPIPFDRLSVSENVKLMPLKNVEGETVVGEDRDSHMLCITPNEKADPGQKFTLTWAGANPIPSKTAEYAIAI